MASQFSRYVTQVVLTLRLRYIPCRVLTQLCSHSYLTSPTIRLIPNPPASQPCSDTQYIVHRALLASKSQYLKKRTRESYILLENTTEETVGLFLEWLYRGDYDVPTSAIDELEDEVEEEEPHPVVMAAMGGCVGVWGYNKPAVHGRKYVLEKARSEGLRSKYVSFDENGDVSVIGGMCSSKSRNLIRIKLTSIPVAKKKSDAKPIQLPSPPLSPKIEHLKPQFPNADGVEHKPTTPPPKRLRKSIVTLDSILASHLALYVLSLRYQIADLAELSLIKISALCESQPPSAETLVGFIRGVYYNSEETGNSAVLTRGTPLREFVAKYSAFRLDEVKPSNGFKKLLADGGEFVVDLVQCVMGGVGKGGVWVN